MQPNIFLVEDDPTMRNLLRTLLEIENYSISISKGQSKNEIIDEIIASRPNIIVLDVFLRNANGIELISHLRSLPEFKSTPVLMTSGTDVSTECMAAGATNFLLKPYSSDELINWVRKQEMAA